MRAGNFETKTGQIINMRQGLTQESLVALNCLSDQIFSNEVPAEQRKLSRAASGGPVYERLYSMLSAIFKA